MKPITADGRGAPLEYDPEPAMLPGKISGSSGGAEYSENHPGGLRFAISKSSEALPQVCTEKGKEKGKVSRHRFS